MFSRHTNRKKRRGITLIELLVAAALAVTLGAVSFQIFVQGGRIWRYASQDRQDLSAEMVLERVAVDLHNAFQSSVISFEGAERGFQFVALVDIAMGGRPAKVSYKFNKEQGSIERTSMDYRRVLAGEKDPDELDVLMNRVSDFKTEFYYYNPSFRSFVWKGAWSDACIPEAVKLRVNYEVGNETVERWRVIDLPASNCQLS